MKPSEYIRRGWTQKSYARNAKGEDVLPNDPSACSWCAHGAMVAAFYGIEDAVQRNNEHCTAITRLSDSMGFSNIPMWNDDPHRSQEEVAAAFEAIGL